MKTKEILNSTKLVTILLLVFIFSYACKKDEINPDYLGAWAVTGTIRLDTIMEAKDIMTFSDNSFSDIMQIKYPKTNKWIDYSGLKGSMSVNGDTMNLEIKEVGLSTWDIISGVYTGNIVYYNDSQSQFLSYLSISHMEKTSKAEYSISENNLTLKTDKNKDGDYSEIGEVTIYSKQ